MPYAAIGAQMGLLVCDRFPEALDKDVVAPGDLPPMLILMSAPLARSENPWLLSCEPWSELSRQRLWHRAEISGGPKRAIAPFTTPMQKAAPS